MNRAERDESMAYMRFVRGIVLETAKFPKFVTDDVRFSKRNQKGHVGGFQADTPFVYAALIENVLYIKAMGWGGKYRQYMLRDASEYGAVDVCERIWLGCGMREDSVLLLCDVIKKLYRANGLRVSTMLGYKPLLRPFRTPPTGAAQQQQLA